MSLTEFLVPAAPLVIEANGWCLQARACPSPNQDARPEGCLPDLLVVHNISLPPGQFGGPYIAELFTNQLDCDAHPYFDQLRSVRVSAHFLIQREGQLWQFVATTQRAWHAGVSELAGRSRCNDFSIGVELEGSDCQPFTEPQYARLAALTVALQQRHALQTVTGHEHIAPGRKTDPGPCFDWPRYRFLCQNLTIQADTGATPAPALCFMPLC